MKQISLTMEESLYNFYKKVGQQAGGLSPEKVMSDALFKLAGELALNALHKNQKGQWLDRLLAKKINQDNCVIVKYLSNHYATHNVKTIRVM